MWVYRNFKQTAFGMHVFVTQIDFETIQEFPSLERLEMFMAEESVIPPSRLGAALLIAGNSVLAIVLLLLQKLFNSAIERVVVLVLINAFIGIIGIVLAPAQCLRVLNRNRLAIAIWALAYCAGYGAFLVFPAQLPLGLFMIASALSPLLGALIFGLREREKLRATFCLVALLPFALLIVLAILEGRFTSGDHAAALFVFVLVSHTAIQFGLRSTAHEPNPTEVSSVVSLINAVLLTAFVAGIRLSYLQFNTRDFLLSAGFAPAVLLLQYLHLSGLRRSTLPVGALAMSTSVPIAVLIEELTSRKFHPLSLTVSGLFVLAVLRRQRPDTAATREVVVLS